MTTADPEYNIVWVALLSFFGSQERPREKRHWWQWWGEGVQGFGP